MRSMWYLSTIIAVLIFSFIIAVPASAAAGTYWTKSYYLNQGQAVMHEIQVDCGAQLVLTSPYGAQFDLYAKKNYGQAGSCPSNQYIMANYDEAAVGKGTNVLYLGPGLWCVVVFARSGNGKYVLEASRYCPYPNPTPVPTYNPNPNPPACDPYRTDVKSGYLNQGQSSVYGYQIPSGRTFIEWILTSTCGDEIPVVMMSTGSISSMRSSYCGPDFDLYIYKDCDPRRSGCYAQYADTSTGSNAYVGVTYPTTGSTYYAQVYAKSGSESYTLTTRTYTCGDDTIMMMAAPEMNTVMYTATEVAPPVSTDIGPGTNSETSEIGPGFELQP